jgi:hypothetical protein
VAEQALYVTRHEFWSKWHEEEAKAPGVARVTSENQKYRSSIFIVFPKI